MSQFDRLRQLSKEAGLDAVALVPGPNLRYLTTGDFHLMERPTILFIPREGLPVMLVPFLEKSKWEKTGIKSHVIAWKDSDGYIDAFRRTIGHMNLIGKKIGVEGLRMRVLEGQLIQQIAQADVLDADDIFIDLRIIKTKEEIEKHRKAIKISEQALDKTLDELRLGMSEIEVAQMLTQFQNDLGGTGNSFSPIVLFGERSALPHGHPENIKLQQGDTVLIDFGTTFEGYVSDITRTFFVGEPSDKFKRVYNAVLHANLKGIQTAAPGIMCETVDMLTSKVLKDADFEEYILHRTGHGLGIDVHEHPNITVGEQRILQKGMVFTVEPGLYLPGELGVRIEDNVVITDKGAESLSKFPKTLTYLELD